MPLMFEQQPRETAKAYAAFSVYLNLGLKRSLARTAKKMGRSGILMERWAKRHNWIERVAAYDRHMAAVQLESAEALVRAKGADWARRYDEQREAEWLERTRLLEMAAEVRRRWMENAQKCGTLEGYARLLELASKLGRTACEKATERKEITGPDGGPIRVEVEAALRKIYSEPLPGEVVVVEEIQRTEDGGQRSGVEEVQSLPEGAT